jgi:hypothetical protein
MILSVFAAFCEGFTGIEPFTQAWAKYFQLWKQVVQEQPEAKTTRRKRLNRRRTAP